MYSCRKLVTRVITVNLIGGMSTYEQIRSIKTIFIPPLELLLVVTQRVFIPEKSGHTADNMCNLFSIRVTQLYIGTGRQFFYNYLINYFPAGLDHPSFSHSRRLFFYNVSVTAQIVYNQEFVLYKYLNVLSIHIAQDCTGVEYENLHILFINIQ